MMFQENNWLKAIMLIVYLCLHTLVYNLLKTQSTQNIHSSCFILTLWGDFWKFKLNNSTELI